MKYLHFFPWLLFLNLSLISYGQGHYRPGYIITNKDETIYGLIKLKSNYQNSKSCDFKEREDQDSRIFSPDDIKMYRIENSKYYVSKEVTVDSITKKVFLEYLLDGIIDLYYQKDVVDEYYFIEKDNVLTPLTNREITFLKVGDWLHENNKIYTRNSNIYKGILGYLFQDSPSTMKKISSTHFAYAPLIDIAKDYHNSVCKEYQCIDYSRSSKQDIYIEPYIGIINTWMGLKTSNDNVYNFRPSLGVQMRFKPLKSFTAWNFLLGMSYSSNNLRGNFNNNLFYYSNSKIIDLYAKYSIVRIPMTLDYTFQTAKLQPFISVSYVNSFLLNSHYAANMVGDPSTVSPAINYMRKYQYGFALGFGLKYKLKTDSYIFVKNELEYRIQGEHFGYTMDYVRCKSWSMNFGYGFRLK